MVRVKDIYDWLDWFAPFRYAASWDQCGFQVGDPEAEVKRVMVALDPHSESFREAEDRGCQCLVTHHPLIFTPLKDVRLDRSPGNLVARALLNGIAVISAHTNLDVVRDGTNGQLAGLLSLSAREPLEPEEIWEKEENYVGLGLVGQLSEPMTLKELVDKNTTLLGGTNARFVGEADRLVRRVALCTGSGGALIEKVIEKGADVYITGDLRHHEALRAMEAGLALIDIGHFPSERIIVEPVVDYLRSRSAKEKVALEVFAASYEKDPFQVPHGQP